MIELHSNKLVFTFPDLRAQLAKQARAWIEARVRTATVEERNRLPSLVETLFSSFDHCIPKLRATISFQRTLRIPDDGRDYPLPPGLGQFPVRHVDDFAAAPDAWRRRGGVMLPMHQTEALWLNFASDYPFAVKVGAGGICAISGQAWSGSLTTAPQNYAVLPQQPWLDGFRISENNVRQFVAVPLGKQLTVEHQLTGQETWGGLQIQVFPMGNGRFSLEFLSRTLEAFWNRLVAPPDAPLDETGKVRLAGAVFSRVAGAGLGAGGRIKQAITRDPHGISSWDVSQSSRCFVHLCVSSDWHHLTGTKPPQEPPTAADYTAAGLPWFDYENSDPSVKGKTKLTGVKSIGAIVAEKTGLVLPGNETVTPGNIVGLKGTGGAKHQP